MKKGLRVFWYNHRKYPFDPYKAVEYFPDAPQPKYGYARIEQLESLYKYDGDLRRLARLERNDKILARTQVDWDQLESAYNDRFNLMNTNPEWFI